MSDRENSSRAPALTPEGGIPRRSVSATEAELLARILEVVPGGIVQVTSDGAIVRANKQAQRFLGLSWDALARRFVSDFNGETFHEDGRPCPAEEYPVVRCLATGQPAGPATIGVRQPSGEVRWGIFTALPFPEAAGVGAIVTFVDITERRRAELRARAHDRVLDVVRMVQHKDDPAATVAVFHEPLTVLLELTRSPFGFVASVDRAHSPPEELRLHARIDERERRGTSNPPVSIDSVSMQAIQTGRRVVVEKPGLVGGPFLQRAPEIAVVLPLRSANGLVGVLGLADAKGGYPDSLLAELEPLVAACADLMAAFDERRSKNRLEAQLAQAERLASVGTLAAGMAHEINNPLAYVLLNLQAFSRNTEGLDGVCARIKAALTARIGETEANELLARAGFGDVHNKLGRISQNGRDALEGAERVQHIVRDLMTFSRVTEERKSLVDVNAALEVALKMADHEIKYRARLIRDLGALEPVLGNDGRLSQVFLNLLLNAARAIEEGHPEQNEIVVRTRMKGESVTIEVADTGAGVAAEHLDRLFEPFFSTRPPGAGAGLGLSICHNVVRAHGGRIEVESVVGKGSRFVVTLPRADREIRRHPTPLGMPIVRQPQKRPRILIVDDEPLVLRVLAQLLARTYDVACADGLVTATSMLEADPGYDVVLCDMMMLDGTGVDVHAWVKEHRPELAERMIFMTGGTFTPKARAFLATVAAHHVVKPFSLRDLDAVVGAILK